jgi:hypothetical protein
MHSDSIPALWCAHAAAHRLAQSRALAGVPGGAQGGGRGTENGQAAAAAAAADKEETACSVGALVEAFDRAQDAWLVSQAAAFMMP